MVDQDTVEDQVSMEDRATMEDKATMDYQATLKDQATMEGQATVEDQVSMEDQATMEDKATMDYQATLGDHATMEGQATVEDQTTVLYSQSHGGGRPSFRENRFYTKRKTTENISSRFSLHTSDIILIGIFITILAINQLPRMILETQVTEVYFPDEVVKEFLVEFFPEFLIGDPLVTFPYLREILMFEFEYILQETHLLRPQDDSGVSVTTHVAEDVGKTPLVEPQEGKGVSITPWLQHQEPRGVQVKPL
ncbi:hypothetical protein OTU49_012785 [Cherax quadricarinatus]|uniref:Uncharacterized protein n=1 Tax=Cherax quadricarinatus TaxID=27406 RepID=A0AAW0VXC2_CHEQU